MNLDAVALFEPKHLNHGPRQPNREAVSPFCDLHNDLQDIHLLNVYPNHHCGDFQDRNRQRRSEIDLCQILGARWLIKVLAFVQGKFWLRFAKLASLRLLLQPDAKPALRFGDKADPLPFEGNFERLLFISIVLTAEVCRDGGPVRRRSRR
jgi:hypothetical protein